MVSATRTLTIVALVIVPALACAQGAAPSSQPLTKEQLMLKAAAEILLEVDRSIAPKGVTLQKHKDDAFSTVPKACKDNAVTAKIFMQSMSSLSTTRQSNDTYYSYTMKSLEARKLRLELRTLSLNSPTGSDDRAKIDDTAQKLTELLVELEITRNDNDITAEPSTDKIPATGGECTDAHLRHVVDRYEIIDNEALVAMFDYGAA